MFEMLVEQVLFVREESGTELKLMVVLRTRDLKL